MVNANETLYVHVPSPPTFCNGHVPIDLFFSYCLSLNILMTYTPCLQCQNIKALFVQPLLSVKFLPSVVSLLSLSINPFAPILKTSVSHFLQYRSKLSSFDWKCLYVSSLSERQFAEHSILDWQSPSSSSSPMPLYAPPLSSPAHASTGLSPPIPSQPITFQLRSLPSGELGPPLWTIYFFLLAALRILISFGELDYNMPCVYLIGLNPGHLYCSVPVEMQVSIGLYLVTCHYLFTCAFYSFGIFKSLF